jgi:acyl carrier protein
MAVTPHEADVLVRELLAVHVGTEPDAITGEMRVSDDLALDSVDAVELLITVERRAGLRFELDQLDDITTVDDIVRRVLAAAAAGTSPVETETEGVAR